MLHLQEYKPLGKPIQRMPPKRMPMLKITKKQREIEEEKERREREGEKEKEETGGEEEDEEEGECKAAYQNVGGGIEATNILLARGKQKGWDLVFVEEAWEGRKGERTNQQGYKAFCQKRSKLVLYI